MTTRAILFAAAGFAAIAAMLAGCTGTTGTQPAFAPVQTLARPQPRFVTPMYICPSGCCPDRLRIYPGSSTIVLGQKITLHDKLATRLFQSCWRRAVSAHWGSNGGSLQVIHGWKAAVFSAPVPGVYTVTALSEGYVGHATVTVTSSERQ